MKTTPWTRRDFLTSCAGFAAAAGVAAGARADGMPQSPVPTSSAGGDNGVLHVFSKPLQWLDYDQTAALAAEAGLAGIDYSVRPGGHVDPARVKADLPRAVAAARAAGLKVEMITTGIVSLGTPHAPEVLACAADLGIRVYRLGNYDYDFKAGVQASLDRIKPALRELADLNARLGLHGAIQNHTGTARVGGSGWDIYELVRDLDPRFLGCQYDINHATAVSGQSWPVTMQLLAPWIRSLDIKDLRWVQSPGKQAVEHVPLGEGIVDFPRYFERVHALGIRGPRSLHFEYAPFERGPALPATEKRAAFLAAMRRDVATFRRLATAPLPS